MYVSVCMYKYVYVCISMYKYVWKGMYGKVCIEGMYVMRYGATNKKIPTTKAASTHEHSSLGCIVVWDTFHAVVNCSFGTRIPRVW